MTNFGMVATPNVATIPKNVTVSLVLVHGAGSGPWIFKDWESDFPTMSVLAVDLQQGLDAARASMKDYCDRVVSSMKEAEPPVALCGWSMGGLVALMATQEFRPTNLVLIEPSPPAEVQGFSPFSPLDRGTFDPEQVYGELPQWVGARRESALARSERKRGISVPSVPCPTLVVFGDEFRSDRGEPVVTLYGADQRYFAGLGHLELVRSQSVRREIASFVHLHNT